MQSFNEGALPEREKMNAQAGMMTRIGHTMQIVCWPRALKR